MNVTDKWFDENTALLIRYMGRVKELEEENSKLHQAFEDHSMIIAELEDANRWIPVSEQKPEVRKSVEIKFLSNGKKFVTVGYYIPPKTVLSVDFCNDEWPDECLDWDEEIQEYWCPEGWFEHTYSGETDFIMDVDIIDWRYLPDDENLPLPDVPVENPQEGE